MTENRFLAILFAIGIALILIGSCQIRGARAETNDLPLPEVRVVCIPGTKMCGVYLPCRIAREGLTQEYLADVAKETNKLRPGSKLVQLHAKVVELVDACKGR